MDSFEMSSGKEKTESNDDDIETDQTIINIDDVVNILSSLQLSAIPQAYVDNIMNSHYNQCKFPEFYNSIIKSDVQFSSIINESCELLNIYLQQSPSKDIVWDKFINNATCCIHPKLLSCLLNCYIQYGIDYINFPNIRKNGLSATRLFFLASTFKGSKNIGFYHIYFLTKCSELIKSCIAKLNITISSYRNEKLQEDEKNSLIADLSAIIQDITIMVKRFQFIDEINSLEIIIDILIEVTRMERVSGNILEWVPTEKLTFNALAFNAYSCLTNMFNDNCGSTLTISQKLIKYLLPGLLPDKQCSMLLNTEQFNAIRDHHLSFIHKLTMKLGTSFQNLFVDKYCFLLSVNTYTDRSVTFKKEAVSQLTNMILKYPNDQNVLNCWFNTLICLVDDQDKIIRDLAIEYMHQVILKNIKPYSSKLIDNDNPLDLLPWRVLDTAFKENVVKYMICLCEAWHTRGFLTDEIIQNLITYVGKSNHNWTSNSLHLLQLISHQLSITNISPIVRYFDIHCDSWFSNEISIELNALLTHAQIVLDILFLNYKYLDKETRIQISDKFERFLFDFKIPTHLISISVDLYKVLLSDDHDKRDKNLKKLFINIFNFIEVPSNMQNEEIMIRHIYTLGDIGLVQHSQIKPKSRQFLLELLNKTDQSVSSEFQTTVILTIGKLSVVDEQFAKEAISQFGVILKNQYHPFIKINVLTALNNLCLQNNLIEQAILEICICLKDEYVPIKNITFKLLTGLILMDDIKLGNLVFIPMLCILDDPNTKVHQKISSFIVNNFFIKNKDVMEQKLVDVIFSFNGYTEGQYNRVQDCFNNPDLKAKFSMKGDSMKSSRHSVYRFMITHMTNDNKLNFMKMMYCDVFNDTVKYVNSTSNNEIREYAIQVMRDALWILKAKEMDLLSRKHNHNNDNYLDMHERINNLVKQRLILQSYKKFMIQCVIPSVLELKIELEKNKKFLSSVLNDLDKLVCTLSMKNTAIKEGIYAIPTKNYINKRISVMLSKHKQKNGKNGSRECELETDDDEEIHSIQDLEYVTSDLVLEIHNQTEESGINQFTKVQMPEVSEIFTAENNLEDEAAANVCHLTGKETPPSKCSISDVTDSDQDNLPAYKLFE